MRTLPAALDAAIKFDVLSLAHIIEIERLDGIIIRLTDCDFDLVVEGNTYRSDIGFTMSALLVGLNLGQVQGFNLNVAITPDGFTKRDLRSRRYETAKVTMSEVDFRTPDDTKLVMFVGRIGRTTFSDTGTAEIEVHTKTFDEIKFADEVYQQTCRASLGDNRCRFPLESFRVDFTVTAVINRTTFIVSTFGPTAAGRPDIDYFSQGQLKWLSGDNDLWEADIMTGFLANRQITTFFPMPEAVKVGDIGKMYPGCDRKHSTCITKFDNVLNYRGEPFAPQWKV